MQSAAEGPSYRPVGSRGTRAHPAALNVPSKVKLDEHLPRSLVAIDLGVLEPGTLCYSCGMGMYTGTITAA